ncbi:MAG: alpha/beta hydrolase [Turicibacter sp.]|nr:alpha/beta hydrolase [Turicibacter sp.]
MKKKKVLIGSGIATATSAAVVGAATWIIGGMVYDGTVGKKASVKAEEMEEFYSNREDKVLEKLEKYEHETVFVNSEENSYEVETLSIKSNQETSDAMIVVHGIGSNYHEVLNVAFNYLENGYNVVVYHQRNTGLTGGDNFTFGLYERFDLEAVAEYTRALYPGGIIGVHGFSMGAATSTMHTELNEESKNVDFYVLDAPYHTMESAVELGIIAENIPFLPVSFAKWAGNVVLKVKERLTYDDIQPVDAVKNITVPVLLIHGKEDKVTSPESSQYIFDAIPHDKKALWYINGLGHCEADSVMEKEYFDGIYQFIATYMKSGE